MATSQVVLSTDRLSLGPWSKDDANAGLAIFGREEVTRWLTPAMEPVHHEDGMRARLESWAAEDAEADPPVGHWVVRRPEDEDLVGSITLRRMPPFQEDLELAWQFAPDTGATATRPRQPEPSPTGRSRHRPMSCSR